MNQASRENTACNVNDFSSTITLQDLSDYCDRLSAKQLWQEQRIKELESRTDRVWQALLSAAGQIVSALKTR